MQRYLIWMESGRTRSIWASSEAEAWLRFTKARHVKMVESDEGRVHRQAVVLARELAEAQMTTEPAFSG